jgi:alkylation response protein AidB-like acyl-CoA dehydrogenase
VVSARLPDAAGISLLLLPADAEGVQRRSYRTFEGTGVADVVLDGVTVGGDALLGAPGGGRALLQRALDEAALLDCMDAVGAMRAVDELTLGYVKSRAQFGGPIGNFQVIQHRLVDMMIAQEMASAMARSALAAASQGVSADELARQASAAKVRVGESARFIAQQTVQLHGGMGLTEEYPAAHYFARLGMFERRWGDSDHHLRRFAEQMAPSLA